jgi:hypothetical protein
MEPKMRPEQAGFWPNKSYADHINTLRIIVEQSIELRSPLQLVFIDFQQAFDTLEHEVIWKALQEKGVPQKKLALCKLYMTSQLAMFYIKTRYQNLYQC